MHTQQLFAPFLVLFVKTKTTKNRRLSVVINKAVSAAILRPAVCVSDVMNKAGMRSKQIKHVPQGPLFGLRWQRANPHGAQIRKQKVFPL